MTEKHDPPRSTTGGPNIVGVVRDATSGPFADACGTVTTWFIYRLG